MKLIIDVGNTRITFALFEEGKIVRQDSVKEKDKYCINYFSEFFLLLQVNIARRQNNRHGQI